MAEGGADCRARTARPESVRLGAALRALRLAHRERLVDLTVDLPDGSALFSVSHVSNVERGASHPSWGYVAHVADRYDEPTAQLQVLWEAADAAKRRQSSERRRLLAIIESRGWRSTILAVMGVGSS